MTTFFDIAAEMPHLEHCIFKGYSCIMAAAETKTLETKAGDGSKIHFLSVGETWERLELLAHLTVKIAEQAEMTPVKVTEILRYKLEKLEARAND